MRHCWNNSKTPGLLQQGYVCGQLLATKEDSRIHDPVRTQEPEPPAGVSKGPRGSLKIDGRKPKGVGIIHMGDQREVCDLVLPVSKSTSIGTWGLSWD